MVLAVDEGCVRAQTLLQPVADSARRRGQAVLLAPGEGGAMELRVTEVSLVGSAGRYRVELGDDGGSLAGQVPHQPSRFMSPNCRRKPVSRLFATS